MTGRGLLTLEQARLVTRQLSPDALADFDGDTGDAAKLTVYVSRQERITGKQAYYAICDLLYQHGFAGAIVLLGVDGTVHGERYPALFFGRNVNVPVIIIATGSTAQVSTAATELAAVVPNPLLTVERARLCKRDGELFPRPQQLARGFDIVDELTSRHELMTSEMVPAALSLDETQRLGDITLAQRDY